MAGRFDKCVINGEIKNTVRGCLTGKLWLLRCEQAMILDLAGEPWPDLAGCKLSLVNTNPVPQP